MAKNYTARKPGTRPVRLDLAEDEHRELRIAAAERDMPMSDLAREVICAWLQAKKLRAKSR